MWPNPQSEEEGTAELHGKGCEDRESLPGGVNRTQNCVYYCSVVVVIQSCLWPPDAKSRLTRKDPDAGKDRRQEEKSTTEDEMVGWHHQLNGHEFEQAPGDDEGQGGLVSCKPWSCKESATTTQQQLVSDSATPWTVARWAHQSMGFSRQEYWNAQPLPSPGDLANLGMFICLINSVQFILSSIVTPSLKVKFILLL